MHWLRSRFAMVAAATIAAMASTAGGVFMTAVQVAHADTGTVSVGTPTDRFTPNITTIHVGGTVTFNWSAGFHIVDLEDVSPDIPMDSTHTTGTTQAFNTAGTFFYYCSIHADEAEATEAHVEANDAMVGKIVVLAAGTATPSATASASPSATSSPSATASATQTATASATHTATATPTHTATSTATAGATQTPNQACVLKVSDQTVAPGAMAVKVDESQQVDPGYMAIHESSATGGPGPVIGFSGYLAGGSHNTDLVVQLDRPLKDGETVWAMLHTENNGNKTYDGASIDLPTVSTHCGNPATGNIATFPIKISFATAGQGGTTAPTPRAPSTGSGTAANDNSQTMLFVALGLLAALLTAGTAATFAYQKRRG